VNPDDGFVSFVEANDKVLLRLAWMCTGDRGKAEDLLQTALAKTWPHWGRLQREGDPYAYVRRVIINTAIGWRRQRWRWELPASDVPTQATPDAVTTIDDRDSLKRALAALSPRQRAAVILRHYEGLSERQAAEVLGCSVGTVKSLSSRGIHRLRTHATNNPSVNAATEIEANRD
jgi:RNA polymerase sigma-70 factor (sigma-E family)